MSNPAKINQGSNTSGESARFNAKEKIILYTIGLIMLMELVDTSVLNTALPQIAFDFKVNPIDLKVAITIYLLTLGMFIPCATWMADRFGVKKMLTIATSGFLVSSIGCGLAHDVIFLVMGRALQGVFGAFMMPIGRLFIVRLFTDKLVAALSFMATIVIIGPLLGPTVGGAITTFLDWRVIFFVNVPIGLFAIWSLQKYFPKVRQPVKNKFDLLGFVVLSASLVLMLFTMDTLVEPSINWVFKLISVCLSAVLMFFYIFYALKKEYPIVDIRLFKDPLFQFFANINIILRLFLMGFSFLFPLYLQTKYQFSAFESGMSMLPFVMGSWIAKRSVKVLLNKWLYKRFMLVLLALILFLNLLLALNFLHFNFIIFIFIGFIIGWAISGLITLANTGVYKGLDEESIAAGTTINSAIIQLGSSFAVAIIAAVLIASSGQFQLDWDTPLPNYSYSIYMLVSSLAVIFMFFYTLKKSPDSIHDMSLT